MIKLVAAPGSTTNCDDLGFLGAHLCMGCQNSTLSGSGGTSSLLEASLEGKVTNTWSIKDKIDGLAGDPVAHKVIVTLDAGQRRLRCAVSTHTATTKPGSTEPVGRFRPVWIEE